VLLDPGRIKGLPNVCPTTMAADRERGRAEEALERWMDGAARGERRL
jgi:hypothetical protein